MTNIMTGALDSVHRKGQRKDETASAYLERRREENVEYRKRKLLKRPPNLLYSEIEYRIVPNKYREGTSRRKPYNTLPIDAPLIRDLEAGKTCLLEMDFVKQNPLKTLYAYFNRRGYQLRIYRYDNPDTEEYMKTIVWLDKLGKV